MTSSEWKKKKRKYAAEKKFIAAGCPRLIIKMSPGRSFARYQFFKGPKKEDRETRLSFLKRWKNGHKLPMFHV